MQHNVMERGELSRRELQDLRNKRTGVTIFQFSWMLVFVCLILVNLFVRSNFVSWPPPGVERLNPWLPTAATVGLIASVWFTRNGRRGIEAGRRDQLVSNWRIVLALGLVFILAMLLEWLSVPPSGQYSTLFKVMTAFHGVHALVIGAILLNVYRNVENYDAVHHWAVEAAAKLWYFVVVAWLLFYTVLYII